MKKVHMCTPLQQTSINVALHVWVGFMWHALKVTLWFHLWAAAVRGDHAKVSGCCLIIYKRNGQGAKNETRPKLETKRNQTKPNPAKPSQTRPTNQKPSQANSLECSLLEARYIPTHLHTFYLCICISHTHMQLSQDLSPTQVRSQ